MGNELKNIMGILVAAMIGIAIFWFWTQYRPTDPQIYGMAAAFVGFILSYFMIIKMEG